MKVCIAAMDEQRLEISLNNFPGNAAIEWVPDTSALLLHTNADFLIDCTFSGNQLPVVSQPLLVHAPNITLTTLQAKGRVARFCAWNTFLQRPLWEIAVPEYEDVSWLYEPMLLLGKKYLLVKDSVGLIAPRIIGNIIQEAANALQEGISTAEEIDLAMKLGTNYPYGPFEWAQKTGINSKKMMIG